MKVKAVLASGFLMVVLLLGLFVGNNLYHKADQNFGTKEQVSMLASTYDGKPYVKVNGNIPFFDDSEITTESFEFYSELDSLGRCGVTFANISKELMPAEDRGEIGMIKPSGWHTVKYPDLIEDLYLYNRIPVVRGECQ